MLTLQLCLQLTDFILLCIKIIHRLDNYTEQKPSLGNADIRCHWQRCSFVSVCTRLHSLWAASSPETVSCSEPGLSLHSEPPQIFSFWILWSRLSCWWSANIRDMNGYLWVVTRTIIKGDKTAHVPLCPAVVDSPYLSSRFDPSRLPPEPAFSSCFRLPDTPLQLPWQSLGLSWALPAPWAVFWCSTFSRVIQTLD